MIEIVDSERCTACNICVHACPTNVFDAAPDGPPVIARQGDCQTCFMCELYCPEDALYVAHKVMPLAHDEVETIRDSVPLGSYRAAIGWNIKGSRRPTDTSFKLLDPTERR